MKSRSKTKFLVLIVLAVLFFLFVRSYMSDYLCLARLQASSASFLAQVEKHYLLSVFLYMLIYTFFIALALPAVAPLTILGGYLFGALPAAAYAVASASLGATIYFLLVRYLFAQTVKAKYEQQLAVFHEKINRYGASYLISLQLLTVIPYFVINTLAALANVPLFTFIWTTIVGGIPLQLIYAIAGRELATLSSIKDILKPSILVLLILMAVVALLPMIMRFLREKKQQV